MNNVNLVCGTEDCIKSTKFKIYFFVGTWNISTVTMEWNLTFRLSHHPALCPINFPSSSEMVPFTLLEPKSEQVEFKNIITNKFFPVSRSHF